MRIPGYGAVRSARGPGGGAVLERLRRTDATATVPVFLLVESPAAEEIVRSKGLPVQGYVRKPLDFTSLVAVVRALPVAGFQVRRA